MRETTTTTTTAVLQEAGQARLPKGHGKLHYARLSMRNRGRGLQPDTSHQPDAARKNSPRDRRFLRGLSVTAYYGPDGGESRCPWASESLFPPSSCITHFDRESAPVRPTRFDGVRDPSPPGFTWRGAFCGLGPTARVVYECFKKTACLAGGGGSERARRAFRATEEHSEMKIDL